MSNRETRPYIVTTSVSGASQTRVWDAHQPLPLGHPFQWVVERTEGGVRVRHLGSPSALGKIHSAKHTLKEIDDAKIDRGAEIDLPHGDQDGRTVRLKIRRAEPIVAAFEAKEGSVITAFACKANWVLDAHTLSSDPDRYEGRVAKKPLFVLERHGKHYSILPHTADLWLKAPNHEPAPLPPNQKLEIAPDDLARVLVTSGQYVWRFGLTSNPTIPAVKKGRVLEGDWNDFGNHLKGMVIGLAAFLLLVFLWPKAEENPKEELIPPQMAKIILQQTQKMTAAPSPATSNPATQAAQATAAPQKVQQAKVVQAFRAQALSNAVSGLLKGGMTKLMAESNFIQGSRDARKIFDTKNQALRTEGPATGLSDAKNMAVASVGGGGKAGYAKGEYAGVKGQGGSFVSMDAGGASVDEGLTKDEVGEVIHRHLAEVRYCYESAMVRTPDIEGKLMTGFVIGPTGMVKTTEVKQSTLPDPRLDDCILRRLMTWKFPNPRGGVEVAVSYPFIFKTLGR